MKKILLGVLLAFVCCVGVAQTNFRDLTYEEALVAAKAENKCVFVDFYTQWCGPCKAMLKDVFPLKDVGDYLNQRFVCIKLDAEKEGKVLAARFKVNAYPTFIGVDVNDNEVMRKVGGGNARDFIASIERQVNPEKTPDRLNERYDAGERTPELIEAYAALKMNEAAGEMMSNMNGYWEKQKEVFRLVNEYFEGLNDEERLSGENLFVYMQYVQSPLDEMARYMVAHREDFDPAVGPRIAERIEEVYRSYMSGCFSGNYAFKKDDYEQVKRMLMDLGLNENGRYDVVFRFIETHAAGDLNAYLTLCEEEFKNLPSSFQMGLLTQIPSLVQTNDPVLLKRTSRFMRNHLAELTPSQLYTVVMVLSQIERGISAVEG